MQKNESTHKSTRFHEFLRIKNIRQRVIAKKIGLDQQSISHFVNGKRQIKDFHALALQATYGVSAEWLLHGRGEMMMVADRSPVGRETPVEPAQRQPEISIRSGRSSSSDVLREVRVLREEVRASREEVRALREETKFTREEVLREVQRVGEDVKDLRASQRNLETRMGDTDTRMSNLDSRVMNIERKMEAIPTEGKPQGLIKAPRSVTIPKSSL